jgi:hypothetical protein
MPRNLQRLCLQDGISINLNRLLQRGSLVRNGRTVGAGIQWTSNVWGVVGTGTMSADMTDEQWGWFSIRMNGGADQHVQLKAQPRYFGGRQWYFLCPSTQAPVSVLWRPNGASRFVGRGAWGPRKVAYRSQFMDRYNRAHHAQCRIRRKLCERGNFDPDEWDLPPKPKGMRQRTYEGIEAKYDHYEAILDEGLDAAAARLMAMDGSRSNK